MAAREPDPSTQGKPPTGIAKARRRISTAWLELDLSKLELTELPSVLPNTLRSLSLAHNQFSTLPKELEQLTALQSLDLSSNSLTSLPEAFDKLTKLQSLDLSSNSLTSLPQALGALTELKGLFLHKNPELGLPDDVLGPTYEDVMKRSLPAARPADILAYYFKTRQAAAPLNEVKMLLVGRGQAGKSSIRDCLLGFGFDPMKTETSGIEIHTWPLKLGSETVRLHVWDFAGQELTLGTHQFFFTERSVYVLVLDARADTQDADAEYWLKIVSAFGGDSPVIVALNKWESKPFDVDRNAICSRFPTVRAFINTDCRTGLGLVELRKEISKTVATMESVREPFPTAWSKTKEAFVNMEKNYVPLETFREKCDRNGVKDKQEQESLVRILHRLGIVLHYADDPRLRDTTVLKPRWVTESIYTLLRLKKEPSSDGLLTFAVACAALPKEKPDMVQYLIGLMRRFELCFPVDETEEFLKEGLEDRWLVPELLPKFPPELGKDWLAADALRLRYKYKVLPEGLLPRFITRTYPLSTDQLRWRAGVVLEMDGAKALVRAGDSQVNVTILGASEGRQRLAKLIRNHFAHLHAELKGFEPEESVEVEGHPGNFKSVVTLERDEKTPNAVTTIETENGSVKIKQTQELNRFSAPASRDPSQRRLQLFLSYSHQDTRLQDMFQQNLRVLEADGLLSPWFDRKILPSAEWGKEILDALAKADIVVCLVSLDFLASKYCTEVEMPRVIDRRKAKEVLLVSVILENCSWENREFAKYQVVLPGGKPVRKWARHRDAFNEVEKILRNLIKEILAMGIEKMLVGGGGTSKQVLSESS